MTLVLSPWATAALTVLVLGGLVLDLWSPVRGTERERLRTALSFSALWVALALGFAGYLYVSHGREPSLAFLAGYLVEKSLSLDNVFVFALIFSSLGIPPALQRRVLAWGVIGALGLRAAMVFAGAALLARFHWLHYVFGGLLVITGIKLLSKRDGGAEAEPSKLLGFLKRVIPHTSTLHGERLFAREQGRLLATPLMLALVLVELSDVLFALDSVPAVFAVTRDPLIVLTANVFAILGLRSLFYLLSMAIQRYHALSRGLSAVLVFVGAKLCLTDVLHVPAGVSLAAVVAALGGALLLSKPAASAPSTGHADGPRAS